MDIGIKDANRILRRLAGYKASIQVAGALVADRERKRPCATFETLDALLQSKPDLVFVRKRRAPFGTASS
jgi:hypothetical protein